MATNTSPWINYVSPWFALSPLQVLALTAYLENRGGGIVGMQSVINVIQNRALYPLTGGYADPDIYDATGSMYFAVCLMQAQFSSYNLGNSQRGIALSLDTPAAFNAELQVNLSLRNAWNLCQKLQAGTLPDITGGANHYFAVTIPVPLWASNMVYRTTIAGQSFYSASPYISQNPQSFIPTIANAGSTVPVANPSSPSGYSSAPLPSGSSTASTANPEALAVTIPSSIIGAL